MTPLVLGGAFAARRLRSRLNPLRWAPALVLWAAAATAQTPLDVLHTFDGRLEFGTPSTALTQTSDGSLYVTSARGGAHRQGAVIKVSPSGTAMVLHSFSGSADGSTPLGAMVLASDGWLYGTTEHGGAAGFGTIYRLMPAGSFQTIHSFSGGDGGAFPRGGLTLSEENALFGTTWKGGPYDLGTAFKWALNGSIEVIHGFAAGNGSPPENFGPTKVDGAYPHAALVRGGAGDFYGTTPGLGWWPGSLFKITSGGVVTPLSNFTERRPYGQIFRASDESLYVTETEYGTWSGVRRFRAKPGFPGLVGTALYDFGAVGPIGAFFQAASGDFYGTTAYGGAAGQGTVFRLSASGTLTTLHEFTGQRAESLIQGIDGSFFGTTSGAGQTGTATIFRLDVNGAVTLLHSYSIDVAGAHPMAALVEGPEGHLYGTTTAGGTFGRGTAFRVTPAGAVTTLHSFSLEEGANPVDALLLAPDGYFYGTTQHGGSADGGTAFRMSLAGSVTVLHSFGESPQAGATPSTALFLGTDSFMYGATAGGGTSGLGTLFRITTNGSVTVLHSFAGGADVGHPGSFLQGADGHFYGTGAEGCVGRVFRLAAGGGTTTLHTLDLSDGNGGCLGLPGIILGGDGNLYGLTQGGENGVPGTFYRVTPGGPGVVIRTFDAGEAPQTPPVRGLDGHFLFADAAGAVKRITAGGAITLLGWQGIGRSYSLLQASDRNVYFAVPGAGVFGSGVLARLRLQVAAPRDLSITTAAGRVRLSWAGDGSGAAYSITRTDASGMSVVVATNLTEEHYVDTSVVDATTYRYVVTASNAFSAATSYEVSMTAGRGVRADFDADGRTDLSVFRPANGTWYVRYSGTGGMAGVQWGNGQDVTVPGDYDGDRRTDIAVFRPSNGTWYVRHSSTGSSVGMQWGNGLDVPVAADYDGDTKIDVAVFRPANGTWYIVNSTTGAPVGVEWGNGQDVPVPGDFDGDGKADIAVFRPANGTWYLRQSGTGTSTGVQWGNGQDVAVPGDYDGDGTTDVAVFRPSDGTWYIRRSSLGQPIGVQWGNALDIPVPGDFDGDGRTDVAVFRPSNGTWYVIQSSTGQPFAFQWGNGADQPSIAQP